MNRASETDPIPIRPDRGNNELDKKLTTAFVEFAGSACLAASLGAGMIASFVVGGLAAGGSEVAKRRRQSPAS